RRLAAGGAVLVVVAAVVAVGHGVIHRNLEEGLRERTYFWQVSRHLIAQSPIWGRGLGSYPELFLRDRGAGHVALAGSNATTDDPHSVPLNMFGSGGLLLGLTYLAFVGFVGWSLVVGLRRRQGSARLLLAAFGGAWVAYQVQ